MRRAAGLHEDLSREEEVKGSSDRMFGLVFAALFAIIGIGPLIRGHEWRPWSVVVAALLLAIAFARPQLLRPFNRLWLRLGLLLHRVVNPVIMGVLFYLVVTPMALIMRGLGKDPLRLRSARDARSYWVARRPPGPSPESMNHQF